MLLLVLFLKVDSLQKVPRIDKLFEKHVTGLTVILTIPELHPVQFLWLAYVQFVLAHSSSAAGNTSLCLTVLLGRDLRLTIKTKTYLLEQSKAKKLLSTSTFLMSFIIKLHMPFEADLNFCGFLLLPSKRNKHGTSDFH